jgi:hypothetical protein
MEAYSEDPKAGTECLLLPKLLSQEAEFGYGLGAGKEVQTSLVPSVNVPAQFAMALPRLKLAPIGLCPKENHKLALSHSSYELGPYSSMSLAIIFQADVVHFHRGDPVEDRWSGSKHHSGEGD